MNKNKTTLQVQWITGFKEMALAAALCAMPALTGGCGQLVTGTYQGTEMVTVKGGNPVSHTVTVTLTQMNNDEIKGSMSSDRSRGDLTGRPNGAISNGPYTLLTTYNGIPVPTGGINCGTYVGQGTLTPRQLNIKLDLTQPAPIPTPLPAGYPNITTIQEICPTSRVISATKQ